MYFRQLEYLPVSTIDRWEDLGRVKFFLAGEKGKSEEDDKSPTHPIGIHILIFIQ
jgi:hypothetical protein